VPSRRLRSPLALVVLGLVAEEPLHPYAMGQRIRERAHDRLPGVRPASLYDVVERLAAAGLISPKRPVREGRRPERVSYEITNAGREALAMWITNALDDPERTEEFTVALSFMFVLERNQVIELLSARVGLLSTSIQADTSALTVAESEGVPPIFLSEHRYQLALRQAQLTWVQDFSEALRSGALKWPHPSTKEQQRDKEPCD
jgi:DNA-binding PadR family transcriptional regulator